MNTSDRPRLEGIYPVLRQLPAALVETVEETAKRVHVAASQQLFDDGSPCADYPLLIEGTVRVSKSSPEGRELLLYLLNPGESCAVTAVALLGETSFPASGP